jgi:mRNA-degrading endonuclease RelE of RelBE toxin-antitoxin system
VRVLLAARVVAFVRRFPPEPTARLRQALRGLTKERGDIKALDAPLDGYCRLRVGGYRIVFSYRPPRTIECIFAERRSVVYEMLLERLRDRLRGEAD